MITSILRRRAWHFVTWLLLGGWLFSASLAQAQTWDWAQAIGGSSVNGYASVYATATDAAGNTYLTGSFSGTISLGSTTLTSGGRAASMFVAKTTTAGQWQWAVQANVGTTPTLRLDVGENNLYLAGSYTDATATLGSTTLTNPGGQGASNVYVAKLSTAGQWQWARQATGLGSKNGTALALDATGAAYVAGNIISGAAVFGPTTLTSQGSVYVAKLSAAGQWQWATPAISDAVISGADLEADATGNLYLAGNFSGATATFGTTALTNAGASYGNAEMYVAKLDGSGSWLWARSAGGYTNDALTDLVLDGSGNVYAAGSIGADVVTFGSISLTPNSTERLFVAKLSPAGQWQWAKLGGSGRYDELRGLVTDAAGNLTVLGGFGGSTLTLGSLTRANTSGTPNGIQLFVGRLSSAGQWQWVGTATGTTNLGDLSLDAAGNAFVGGSISTTTSFGSTTLRPGTADAFVAKLDGSGQWLWATQSQGGGSKFVHGTATDAAGNVYAVGSFTGTVAFGTTTLSSNAGDAFVGKLDANGQWLWAVRAGGSGHDQAQHLALDGSGNVYVTGLFSSADAAFGGTTLSTSGGQDVFVAKLSGAGQWQWARRAGGTTNDEGYALAANATGRVSVVGQFASPTAAFGSTTLTNSVPGPFFSSDVFVAQLDTDGQWLWARAGGGGLYDYSRGVATDAAGNVYWTGYCESATVTFGPHTINSTISGRTSFVAKLSSTGQWQWVTPAGAGSVMANGLVLDPGGNVFVAGSFYRSAVLGSTTLTSTDSADVFVARMSPAGQWQWAVKAGTTGDNAASAIVRDAAGHLVIGGTYRGRALNFGSSVQLSSSGRVYSGFLAGIDTNGQWLWAAKPSGSGHAILQTLSIDAAGRLYSGGYFFGDELGFGPTTLRVTGGYHATGWLARFTQPAVLAVAAARQPHLAEAFPNPFARQLTIRLPESGPTELLVHDALGRLRLRRTVQATAGQAWTLAEAETWPAGVYLLTVRRGEQQQTIRLLHP